MLYAMRSYVNMLLIYLDDERQTLTTRKPTINYDFLINTNQDINWIVSTHIGTFSSLFN